MSKQTFILIIILSLFTAGLLALALNKSYYTPKAALKQPSSLTPTINPYSPDTSLLFGDLQVVIASESAAVASDAVTTTFDVAKTPLSGANTYSLPIIINTGANNVTAVQLELAFDPSILTDVNMNPSSFFEDPAVLLNRIDSKQGRISYALAASDAALGVQPLHSGSGVQGESTLATITFQTTATFEQVRLADVVKTASETAERTLEQVKLVDETKQPIPRQTNIIFLPKTFVAAEGLSRSALKSTDSARLKFTD